MKNMKEILKYKVLALVPEYTKEGANFTRVLLLNRDGVILKKNINSSLKTICQFYHFDLKSSNKTAKEMLGMTKSPPIAIANDLVFIAVKTRTPIGRDDGAYSYINIAMIEKVREGNRDINIEVEIIFKDGKSLKVISSAKTIEKSIKYANILKQTISSRIIDKMGMVKESQEEFYIDEYAGLRKDLDIIYRKLQTIEKTLFK